MSGENNKSGGRHSIPFLIEEERTLPLQKAEKVTKDFDEPEIAENIPSLPDKIFDEARSSIIIPPERSEFIGSNNKETSDTTDFAPATGSQQTSAQTVSINPTVPVEEADSRP